MSTEEQDQNKQDGGSDGGLGFKAWIWRGSLVAVTGGALSGSILRFLRQAFDLPGDAVFSMAGTVVIVCIIAYFEPRTMRDLGLMILVNAVTGAFATLVTTLFSMHFEGFFAVGLGNGLGGASGAAIALLACWRLGITQWRPFLTTKPDTNSTPHP